jgi:hypothetical protein
MTTNSIITEKHTDHTVAINSEFHGPDLSVLCTLASFSMAVRGFGLQRI